MVDTPYTPSLRDAFPDTVGQTYQERIDVIIQKHLTKTHLRDAQVIKFINSYIHCQNARQAAEEAGLHKNAGRMLLNNRDIGEAVEEIIKLQLHKFGYTAHQLVEREKEIAEFDPIDVVDSEGRFLLDLRLVPPEARRAIKEIKVDIDDEKDPNGFKTGRVYAKSVTYKFHDKHKAVELLAREKEVFKDKKVLEYNVGSNMRELLLEGMGKAEGRIRDVAEVEGEND